MIKTIILLFIFSLLNCPVSGSDFKIKSHRTYANEREGSFPIVILDDDGSNELAIEFDVESDFQPDLSIVFSFCNKDWAPYESYLLQNPGSNTSYSLWFDALPVSVDGASFHFKGTFPNFNVSFPFSGKWMYFIIDNSINETVATGKFFVVRPEVKLFGNLSKDRLENVSSNNGNMDKSFRLKVDFQLPDELFPGDVEFVEIIENQVIDYPYIIDRYEYGNLRYIEWDASRQFSFIARDIIPGNEYRTLDFTNSRRFFEPVIKANIDGFDNTRVYDFGGFDHNGSSHIVDFKNDNSEYFNVSFRLQPYDEIYNDVFLIGSFNNWQVLPEYQLENNYGRYELNVELKRGRYDYQYVTGDNKSDYVDNINWNVLEGNFWETRSDYHIFLFYNSTDLGGYDKIIGYYKLSGGVK